MQRPPLPLSPAQPSLTCDTYFRSTEMGRGACVLKNGPRGWDRGLSPGTGEGGSSRMDGWPGRGVCVRVRVCVWECTLSSLIPFIGSEISFSVHQLRYYEAKTTRDDEGAKSRISWEFSDRNFRGCAS